jgi:chorismate mutase
MRNPFKVEPGATREPASAYHAQPTDVPHDGGTVDLERRRDQLTARVAELQWDLGGLVYEMAIRDRIRVDVLVKRAATLQEADAELGEVERILKMDQTSTAGTCPSCGAPHSSGAVFCWQCGHSLLPQVSGDSIVASPARSGNIPAPSSEN